MDAYARLNYESNQSPTELISGEELTFDRFDETEVPCTWSDSRQYGGCGSADRGALRGGGGRGSGFLCQRRAGAADRLHADHGGVERALDALSRPPVLEAGAVILRRLRVSLAVPDRRRLRSHLRTGGRRAGRAADHPNALPARGRVPALVAGDRHVPAFKHRWDTLPQYGVRSSNGTTNSNLPTQTD